MRLALALALAGAVAVSAVGGLLWQKRPASAQARPALGASGGAGPAAPLRANVHLVTREPFEIQVQATGTLLPRESVELVSELNRRLVRVRAEEGSEVKKGQVLFELDSADLRAELGKLAVDAQLARVTLDRAQKLSNEGLSTQAELDAAKARVDSIEAQRQLLGVTLAKTVIRAPFAGKLGLRRVSEGAWVSPSTVLTTLQDTSTLKLDFTLPERYGGLVSEGRQFRFKVAGRGETFNGQVAAHEPSIDRATRSILVRGRVEHQPNLLPGAFATVEVPLQTEEALLVPAIALIPGVEGQRVFVARDGVARSVAVQAGARTADRVQIVSGLEVGDRVLVSNLLRLRDGAKIEPLPPGAR